MIQFSLILEREPQLKSCLYQILLESSLWSISLNKDGCRKIQLTMGWVGSPGWNQKANWANHREQSSKQHSSMVFLPLDSCPEPLLWLPWMVDYYQEVQSEKTLSSLSGFWSPFYHREANGDTLARNFSRPCFQYLLSKVIFKLQWGIV